MGRYDKIRVYNGSSWVQPSNMYVYNGSSWVHFGANTSYTTNGAYMYNGSAWVRSTLNRQDYTTYNSASDQFTNYTGTSTALTITSGMLTVATRRVYAPWNSYLYGMLKTINSEWWAGTTAGSDGSEDWHQWTWSGARWISRLRFMSVQSTYYNTAPHTALVSYRNASGTWTGETSISIVGSYGAQNTWGNYFTFNAKTTAGYTGLKMRYLNNLTYKATNQSTRIGRFALELGTITTGANWV